MPKLKVTSRDGSELTKKRTIVKNKTLNASELKSQWWKEEDPHSSIFGIVDCLAKTHQDRQMQYMMAAWLYQNQEMLTFRPGSNLAINRGWNNSRLSFNVLKSAIDTLRSKISKDNPYVTFLTQDGSYEEQVRARQLNQYLQGLFNATNTYDVAQDVFLDACVFGTGCLYLYPDLDNETVGIERVLPDEIIVDELEAVYGQPRQLHRRKLVSKTVLKAQFPEHEDLIDSVGGQYLPSSQTVADVILVVESWHLKSSRKSKDGRHTITINNGTLLDDEFTDSEFPFLFFKWDKPLDGFYGLGVVHELQPIQMEISKTMRSIQLGLHYMAVPRILVEANSQVDIGHLHNTIDGQVVTYIGTAPEFWVPGQVMSGDTYQWVENLIQKAYKEIGVSELSATSTKPKGEVSGEALRNLHDVETERFIIVGQRWEKFFVDLGQRMVRMSAAMYSDKDNKVDISVKTPGSKWLKTIKWSQVSLEEDRYTMQAFPTQLLPHTPAGRLQTVQDLMQAGLIPPDIGFALLRLPDTDSAFSLIQANFDAACWQVSQIVESGTMPALNPNQDLEILLKVASQTSVKLMLRDEIPEEHKDLLQQFIDTVKATLAPPPEPMPIQPMGPALGVPEAPAASPLIPNAPVAA